MRFFVVCVSSGVCLVFGLVTVWFLRRLCRIYSGMDRKGSFVYRNVVLGEDYVSWNPILKLLLLLRLRA